MLVNSPTLTKAVPVMPSRDFDNTVSFYEQLGFSLIFRYDDYLALQRDQSILHFWKTSGIDPADNYGGCYIYVDDATALYQDYQSKGAIHPNGALKQTFYGVLEFAVADPDNNLLRIGQIL